MSMYASVYFPSSYSLVEMYLGWSLRHDYQNSVSPMQVIQAFHGSIVFGMDKTDLGTSYRRLRRNNWANHLHLEQARV